MTLMGESGRVAFAFNPSRKAILLVCGDKSGGSGRRFYDTLIDKADSRFDAHLAKLKREEIKKRKRKWKGRNTWL